MPFPKSVPVFRAGINIDSAGRSKTWTIDDLDTLVRNAKDAVPHVITHAELYSPFAYARSSLRREEDVLWADTLDTPEPQFAALVEAGRLYSRSIRTIPTQQGPMVAHIAWLGAEPPAVEGLPPYQFAAGGEPSDYSMSSWAEVNHAEALGRMMRRMREFLISKFTVEEADRVMPEYDLATLDEYVVKMRQDAMVEADANEVEFSRTVDPATASELETLRTENARLAEQIAAGERSRVKAEFSRWVDDQVDALRLLPAEKPGMVEELLALSSLSDYSAEGQTVNPVRRYQQRIETRPPQLHKGDSRDTDPGPQASDYSREDPQAMAAKARALVAKRGERGERLGIPEAIDLVAQGVTE